LRFGFPLVLAAWLPGLCLVGCDRAPPNQPGARRGASVQVINASDYAWVVTLTRATDRQKRTARLAPRAEETVVLPGGDYVVEQVAADGELATGQPRRFAARIEAGQVYRWPVTTLLSAAAGPGDPGLVTPAP
jgi:hypothetical protein